MISNKKLNKKQNSYEFPVIPAGISQIPWNSRLEFSLGLVMYVIITAEFFFQNVLAETGSA